MLDCAHEFCSSAPAQPVTAGFFRGLPSRNVTCKDGDPTCDISPPGDGICVFRVAMCFNVADPRLGCDGGNDLAAAEFRAGVTRVGWRRPDLDRPKSDVDKANSKALMDAMTSLGAVFQPGGNGAHSMMVFNPPLTGSDVCTSFFTLQARVRQTTGGAVQTTQAIRLRIYHGVDPTTGQTPHYDGDDLNLTCVP